MAATALYDWLNTASHVRQPENPWSFAGILSARWRPDGHASRRPRGRAASRSRYAHQGARNFRGRQARPFDRESDIDDEHDDEDEEDEDDEDRDDESLSEQLARAVRRARRQQESTILGRMSGQVPLREAGGGVDLIAQLGIDPLG